LAKRQTRNPGFVYGFRSGLEEQIAKQLHEAGLKVDYESEKIAYIKPARNAKYTPDFILPNGIIIESKGRFVVEDRQKHLIIKEQYPALDIRFVFSNSRTRISKNSKTTYAMWCDKHGLRYADKFIPQEWLDEPVCEFRLAALDAARVKK
jgi:hypothetical protein